MNARLHTLETQYTTDKENMDYIPSIPGDDAMMLCHEDGDDLDCAALPLSLPAPDTARPSTPSVLISSPDPVVYIDTDPIKYQLSPTAYAAYKKLRRMLDDAANDVPGARRGARAVAVLMAAIVKGGNVVEVLKSLTDIPWVFADPTPARIFNDVSNRDQDAFVAYCVQHRYAHANYLFQLTDILSRPEGQAALVHWFLRAGAYVEARAAIARYSVDCMAHRDLAFHLRYSEAPEDVAIFQEVRKRSVTAMARDAAMPFPVAKMARLLTRPAIISARRRLHFAASSAAPQTCADDIVE